LGLARELRLFVAPLVIVTAAGSGPEKKQPDRSERDQAAKRVSFHAFRPSEAKG
jgi:hypothetical protein